MHNIIDISWPITTGMTSYKNNKPIAINAEKIFDQHHVRDSSITLNAHTGTHIDAPSHFLSEGACVDQIALTTLIGTCRILDLTHVAYKITAQDLFPYEIQAGEIILLKTKNSALSSDALFDPHFVYLEKTGAAWLADKKVKAVGIDYLGIEREQPDHETHCILFEHQVTIIEGLRLKEVVMKDTYVLLCLPLALQSTEASPARAILIPHHSLTSLL